MNWRMWDRLFWAWYWGVAGRTFSDAYVERRVYGEAQRLLGP